MNAYSKNIIIILSATYFLFSCKLIQSCLQFQQYLRKFKVYYHQGPGSFIFLNILEYHTTLRLTMEEIVQKQIVWEIQKFQTCFENFFLSFCLVFITFAHFSKFYLISIWLICIFEYLWSVSVYVDASIGCNKIGFRLGDETSTTRWTSLGTL